MMRRKHEADAILCVIAELLVMHLMK